MVFVGAHGKDDLRPWVKRFAIKVRTRVEAKAIDTWLQFVVGGKQIGHPAVAIGNASAQVEPRSIFRQRAQFNGDTSCGHSACRVEHMRGDLTHWASPSSRNLSMRKCV